MTQNQQIAVGDEENCPENCPDYHSKVKIKRVHNTSLFLLKHGEKQKKRN